MSLYFDTSALLKLYTPERETARLSRWLQDQGLPLVFTSLHELELFNSLELKLFRKEISRSDVEKSSKDIRGDVGRGVYFRPPISWNEVFTVSVGLSHSHTATEGYRSLDILHVASALVLNCSHFVTYDNPQLRLARRSGLNVLAP